ncbi:ABC transporter substrate-binding protein [Amycolatopsis alkalitolerans]|uniref:Thiamine pyrimidine synthase n=1 Tax=Amycolatopsis alkalitolerans TaxID=2547244 RepID=A0A5C4LT31_9PSEU|nr:ABC transporter substrate-binding protein [Amycolatopsis alkalitolerans]TNC20456.1 ABC transporter substrate-binding protein [Amycolatopsis alkalitolerans]
MRPSPQLSGPVLGRRRLLQLGGLGAATLGAGALLSACGDGSSASGSGGGFGDLSIQLSWIKNIEFAGEYFADAKGYYKQAGFGSVNLIAGGSAGTSAEAAVATGKALVGLSSPTITAPAIMKGAPLKTIASTYQKNPFCILSLDAKPIRDVAALKGRKIGVQSGGNTTIFNGLLAANGIDPSALSIVPVQYDPTVLTTGEVEGYMAYTTNEPILLAGKGVKTAVLSFADAGLPFVAETMVVSQSAIDNQRDKLKALLVAEIKGWTGAVADPRQSATYAVTQYGKDQNLAQNEQEQEAGAQNKLVVTPDSVKNGLFTMTGALVEENIKSLEAMKMPVSADKLFDLSLLREVYTEHPELISAFAAAAGPAK